MAVNLFDVSYYRLANPDLAQVGLTTDTQLSSHFQTFGLNEGRAFSPVVDLNLYRNFNPDLDAAGIKTNQQILTHLQNSGVAEGRRFSEFVDLDFYLQANQDVRQAFQGNQEQTLLHLLNSGVQEGRKFSPFVDVNFYLANNTDVNVAFGGDRFQSLRHLVNSGLKEERLFSPFVDLNLYKTFNPDRQNLDNNQAFQNLVTVGVGEGRQFSHSLDLSYYGFYNPDLITAYAASKNLRTEAVLNNPTQLASLYNFLLQDFDLSGISQGRRSSDEFDVTYYRARNQDLANLSNQQLYEHFRSNGIEEVREFSDSYDALYYQNFNSAPNGFNLSPQQLYEYYITTGLGEGDIATFNPKFTDEVVSDFDLISGNASINSILNSRSDPNPDRAGSYADTYLLSGLDPGLQSIIAGKENVERSDILALFNQAKTDGVISTTEQKDFKKLADNAVRLRIRNYVKFGLEKVNETLPQNSNATPDLLQQAVDRWFLGKVPPSPQYVGKGDTARGPAAKEIKNVTHLPIQGNLFGNNPDGTIRGINQGQLGDCAFLAAVAATFGTPQFEGNENTSSATIKQMLRDNGDGTYTFRFFDNGDPFYVTVNSQLATVPTNNTSINYLPFAQKGGEENIRPVDFGNGVRIIADSRSFLPDDGNSIWIPLLERAYAQFRELTADGRFRQVTGDNGGYSLIGNGDNVTDPLERMTGRKATTYGLTTNTATNDFITLYNFDTQKQATFEDIANALTQGRAIEVGTSDNLPNFPSDLLVGSHAYAVTRAYIDSGNNPRVVVRNPWGNDGGDKPVGNVNDGFIDLTFEQFKNGFDGMAIA